ncbi:MAG: hypothetical protein EP340_07030 [Alphaproteobacteria bacterium]|nr:MAG: hypothetical protein EP340_07030 [Alphaproteobacteria bacterium]
MDSLKKGAITSALLGFGLSGCAANAENTNLSETEEAAKPHMRYVFLNVEEEGAQKIHRLKIKKDDGSEPIVITTTDPKSEEFKTAMAQLKEQGIELDLDAIDPEKLKAHQLNFEFEEGKDFNFIMKDGPLGVDGLVINEFKDGDEWVSEDGTLHIIKKLEDGETVLHITKEDVGKKIFLMKDKEKDKDKDGASEIHVEKRVFIIKDTDGSSESEEAPDSK